MAGATHVAVTMGSDEERLAAAARRDPDAFGELYRVHVAQVYRFCLRRLGDREAAEDATAQVFTKALAAMPGFRGGSFQGWLFAIAHRVVIDGARSGRLSLPLDAADALADPRAGPEDIALCAEEARGIRRLLDQLPVDQRRVVELRLAGLNGVEIAQALGRSHGTIRNLQHRSLLRLRDLHRASMATDEDGRPDATRGI